MTLTLEEANRIAAGAIEKAEELGILINVAVCDVGGRLIAFQRMDNAMWAGLYGSQGKAVASASFGQLSGVLAERAEHPTFKGIQSASGGHMIFGRGAAPIRRGDVLEGAVGVGGGTGEEDEICALAGAAKL